MSDLPTVATGPSNNKVRDLLSVLEISRHLAASTELLPLLERIERSTRELLGCQRASVFLYDRRADELYSQVATGVREVRFSAGAGVAGDVFRKGTCVVVPDAYADARFNPEIDRLTGFRTRSILACPLLGWDNSPLGVLQALNAERGHFGEWEQTLLTAMAAQAGVAVQRWMLFNERAEKQRLERELEVARMIQQRLLPTSPPEVAGFEIAGWNRPADATGGDFYDIHLTPDGSVWVALADATGHGIGPALIATESRALWRALHSESKDLPRVLTEVNRLLCEDLPEGDLVTAFLGRLDPPAARLHFLSAGQGPLLLYRATTHEITTFSTHGLPLAVGTQFPYDLPTEITFEPGDWLGVFTDGFDEWPNADRQRFGQDRLKRVLLAAHRAKPGELIQALVAAVTEFAQGSPQRDDLTGLVIKKT